jgi:hypothetical protein
MQIKRNKVSLSFVMTAPLCRGSYVFMSVDDGKVGMPVNDVRKVLLYTPCCESA